MKVLTGRFLRKALVFYGYILAFLIAVLVVKIAISGAFESFSPGSFLALVLQPLNIYVWGFVTVMYFVFVAVVAGMLKSSGNN